MIEGCRFFIEEVYLNEVVIIIDNDEDVIVKFIYGCNWYGFV